MGTEGLRRGSGREGSASGDSQCFSHPLVTVWEKEQKRSSEKREIGKDVEGGPHPKPHQRTEPWQKHEGIERKTEFCWVQQSQGRVSARAVTPPEQRNLPAEQSWDLQRTPERQRGREPGQAMAAHGGDSAQPWHKPELAGVSQSHASQRAADVWRAETATQQQQGTKHHLALQEHLLSPPLVPITWQFPFVPASKHRGIFCPPSLIPVLSVETQLLTTHFNQGTHHTFSI